MAEFERTPLDQIPLIRDELRKTFREGKLRPLAWRRKQLHQLARLAQENADALADALLQDLGKPKMEVYMGEIGPIVSRSLISAEKLEEWAKPSPVAISGWQKDFAAMVYKAPKGVVLNIAPWNAPMILSLQPLIGAIAAGCCAVIKPSELVPSYARLIAELLPKYLDTTAYRVVNGGVEETTKLLSLQWDHIVYTGGIKVGKIVAAAAAQHLTPVTLELGGKSPVIIDLDTDLSLAAKRILWGKCQNAGQICVAPDYVLIPREKQDEFVAELKKHHDDFFPEGTLRSKSFGRIVSAAHHERLVRVLNGTQGKIVLGGHSDELKGFEATIVRDVQGNDSLMEDEIFGPILPIVPVDSILDAIDFVNARPHPLVLYAFTENQDVKSQITESTLSGNIIFNDTFQQMAVDEIPFGGVGDSGYGHLVLKATYDGFTHYRSSVDVPKGSEEALQVRYPPYTEAKLDVVSAEAHLEIPGDH